MGYVVGMLAVSFVPAGGDAACALPPERPPSADETSSAPSTPAES